MAINSDNAKLLFYAKKLGVSFVHSLMLGRLNLSVKKDDLQKYIAFFQNHSEELENIKFRDYAEPLFELLGATKIDSIDYSDYENATITHDLNTPIPFNLKMKYSAVIDGGTLEHIFNFPMAIKNCMEALQIGGHFISFTPANNTLGHGFYQFSPELYYRIFSEQNGFKVKFLAIYLNDGGNWYSVADPEIVKSRIILKNSDPTHLIVIAEKIEEKEIFSVMPQQSDYNYAWNLFEADKLNNKSDQDSRLLYLYKRALPLRLRLFLRKYFDYFFKQPKVIPGLGTVNPRYFKKIDIGI